MASLSDQIERYLRNLLNKFEGVIEIKRNKLADDFNCAPSQINYVLNTRFTMQRGYVVESQRGGGGYIRVIKVDIESKNDTLKKIINKSLDLMSQSKAEAIIERLFENELISKREKYLMKIATHRKIIGVDLPHRDYIRGRILKGMLEVVLKYDQEED